MSHQGTPILLLGLAVIAFGLLIAGLAMRRYRRDLGMGGQDLAKTPDTSFVINAFQDVTRQLKEKEKELERLKSLAEQRAENVESYTENILQCVTSGVIAFDGSGLATTMNRAAEEILGIAHRSGLGRTCAEIFGDGDICRLVRETRDRNAPSRRMEAELMRKTERVWLGFNTALLTDRQGATLGVILSFSDLTEVKRLQGQVELKERLTALGEMSAGIAHELRNPMAVIAGYLNLLAKKQDAATQAVIGDVQTEIAGMDRIISDLLAFARPTALNRNPVGVKELLESCLDGVLQARGGLGAIRTVLTADPGTASVDEGLMRQALINILQNAVEAMPDGGSLTIMAKRGRQLSIAVQDTGPGIPRENIGKIFLPFFTTREKGVGMGLALAHKVVTAHGGRIDVKSREGNGTVFTIVLPLD